MRYISLSRNVQIAMCLLVLMMVGWAGASWIKMRPYTQVLASYREALSTREALLAQLSAERDSARTHAQNLNSEINTLHVQLSGALNQVAEIKDAQFTLMAQIQERTKGNAYRLEQAIKLTGLNLNTLGGKTNAGVGGPLMAASKPATKTGNPFADMNDMFEDSVAEMETQMSRWARLEGLFEHLPIVAPINTGQLSSRFGKRQDPFTNRWATHNGLDLSAPLNTPAYSTAPGKVTFAGRNGPYGYMVEIDHGLGLTTRHGHLNKLLVKSGEQVGLRHKIGLVGSSGRSTGPHLHYEVMFQGKPHDPARFLEAGKYVFQK
ncbi:MAG: M23 family metallopeptidase [Proteobacteria bacterium]|nr:M23 family metallopeptidase [Pseudomonadota bacterium]